CSSARARSSGTCARCSGRSACAHARSFAKRWPETPGATPVIATGATGGRRGDRGLTNHEALKEADMATAPVEQAPGLFRTDIQHSALSVPGRVVIQNRVEIHQEAPFVWHKHPGEEVIYVIAGSLEYHLEGQEPFTVEAGNGFTVPAEVVH